MKKHIRKKSAFVKFQTKGKAVFSAEKLCLVRGGTDEGGDSGTGDQYANQIIPS